MLCAFYFEKMRILVLFRFLCFYIFRVRGSSVIRLAGLGSPWCPSGGSAKEFSGHRGKTPYRRDLRLGEPRGSPKWTNRFDGAHMFENDDFS